MGVKRRGKRGGAKEAGRGEEEEEEGRDWFKVVINLAYWKPGKWSKYIRLHLMHQIGY